MEWCETCNIRMLHDNCFLICPECGLSHDISVSTAAVQAIGTISNTPLVVCYSRINRFKTIIEQLFEPTVYGNPNSRILYELQMIPPITTPQLLLKWLTDMNLPDKKYQSLHYYFLWSNRWTYDVPTKPRFYAVHNIMGKFIQCDRAYEKYGQQFSSFFSYNWLLAKFLTGELEIYKPFIKPIKCRRRRRKYEIMYNYLLSPERTSAAIQDMLERSQTQPFDIADGDPESPNLYARPFSNLLPRSRLNRLAYNS